MRAATIGRVAIVGASAAGLSAAEALRRGGYQGELTLIGKERHLPYDRPPLSKQILTGDWTPNQVLLRTQSELYELDVTTRLGQPAVGLDIAGQRVLIEGSDPVAYDRLIITTGVTPKTYPDTAGIQGIHTLRTLDDALKLRDALQSRKRLVVVGAGFLGAEIAAVAAAKGLNVTLLSNSSVPLRRVLGTDLGHQLAAVHRAQGVTVLAGPSAVIKHVHSENLTISAVTTIGGDVLPTDMLVVTVGSEPATSWLHSSGLTIEDGVVCSADCSAAPNVYAAGDVARWNNTLFATSMRVEHRTNAVDQAIHVATQILADSQNAYTPIPYFWSDQYDLKIQGYGWLRDHDEAIIIEGSLAQGKFIAIYRRGNYLTGVVGLRSVKALRHWRQLLASRTSWAETQASLARTG